MGVVERHALGRDGAVPVAEAVALGQRGGEEAVALLEAVAHEEAVGVAQGVVDLDVELVVLPLLVGVDHVVVDGLTAAASPAVPCWPWG